MRRPTIYLYRDLAGEWRWRFVATNGRTLADSGEGYGRIEDAQAGAILVAGRRARRMFVIGLP